MSDLGITNIEVCFCFTVVDLYLPSVEVALDHQMHRMVRIGNQRISWSTIKNLGLIRQPVVKWRYDDESQKDVTDDTLSEHRGDGLIPQVVPFACSEYAVGLVGDIIILSDIIWCGQSSAVSDEPQRPLERAGKGRAFGVVEVA